MVKKEITPDFMKSILMDSFLESSVDSKVIDEINTLSDVVYSKISQRLRPKGTNKTFLLHDLSSDQRDRVISTINRISDFNESEIVSNIESKKAALEKTMELKRTLRESLKEDDIVSFLKQINDKENFLAELKRQYAAKEEDLEKCKEEISNLEKRKNKN